MDAREQKTGAEPTVSVGGSTVAEWAAGLAAAHGNPGGGAAAGVMLSFAAALVSMVAGYTEADRYADAPEDDEWERQRSSVAGRARDIRHRALALADADAAVSGGFGAAFRHEPGPERDEAVREASLAASRSSEDLGDAALPLIDDLEWVQERGNPALRADVVVAEAALRAALVAARANLSNDLHAMISAEADGHDDPARPALEAAIDRFDAGITRLERSK
jgi:formiminotetrahydrofolate cyclodeaminase